MENSNNLRYKNAKERVEEIKSFYTHLAKYVIVITLLAVFNNYTSNFPWVIFVAIGWGIGILSHALSTFGHSLFLGKDWEEQKIKELMDRDEI